MSRRCITTLVGLLFISGLLAACSGEEVEATAVQTAIAQTQAVEDAVATSVRATLQATQSEAEATATTVLVDATDTPADPTTATAPLPTATNTPADPATATAPLPTATDTPADPATATALLPTATDTPADTPTLVPTDTPLPTTATATRVKVQIAESQVDGNDGNDFLRGSSSANQGRVILLPGFDQSEVTSPPVFRYRLVFRVEVFDTRVGMYDGAGIDHVDFFIEPDDGSGQIVYERTERNAGYCAFGGGEPDCNVLTLESGSRWPDPFGGEILNGHYLARIDIVPENDEPTQWRWRFEIAIPGEP